VVANDRQSLFFIEPDGLRHTGFFTAPAPNALLGVQQYAAAFTRRKRPRNAKLRAVRLPARMAHRGHELAGKPPAGAYVDAAFADGVVLAVKTGAYQHTREAAYAFIHFLGFYHFGQRTYTILYKCDTSVYHVFRKLSLV
jgi:hypothetical protein